MKTKIVVMFVVAAVILSACGVAATAAPSQRSLGTSGGAPNEQAVAPAPAAPYAADANGSGKTAVSNASAQSRMITMTVDLSIVVADPQKRMDVINQMAKDMGGYLISMNMSQVYTPSGTTAPQGTISIRVPAEKLDTALSQIKTGVVSVQSENRSGQDVTSQYVDLKSQLTNLQQAEQDLLAIMDEAKNNPGNNSTTKTQDVLNVYNQIVSIRGQIEQIQGQMKLLEETTSTSAINVTLIAEETVQPIQVGGWKPVGKVNDAIQTLIKFWQGFVNFLIYLVLLVLPILITIFGPIALVLWGIVALVRWRRAKKSAQMK
jgi:hypothetical protein